MRQIGLAAILVVAVSAGAAHAELCSALDRAPDPAPDWARDWCRRVEGLARALIGGRLADHEIIRPPIITPPGNIDPQMSLVPPQARGMAPIIIPPGEPGR